MFRSVISRKILMLPKVNAIFLKLNFDQITIVNYEIIGVARATSLGTPLSILQIYYSPHILAKIFSQIIIA